MNIEHSMNGWYQFECKMQINLFQLRIFSNILLPPIVEYYANWGLFFFANLSLFSAHSVWFASTERQYFWKRSITNQSLLWLSLTSIFAPTNKKIRFYFLFSMFEFDSLHLNFLIFSPHANELNFIKFEFFFKTFQYEQASMSIIVPKKKYFRLYFISYFSISSILIRIYSDKIKIITIDICQSIRNIN